MPQLSKDDNVSSRLSRAAYLFALRYWRHLGGIGAAFKGAQCGVLQLARDAAHGVLQAQIAAQRNDPPEFAQWLDADAAHACSGLAAPHGAWLFRQGGWAHPAGVCAAMLAKCGDLLEAHFGLGAVDIDYIDGRWQVRDANGKRWAQAPTLILANGAGAGALAVASELPLAAVRGQVTHLDAAAFATLPMVVCREAYITPAINGVASVGASYDADGDRALRMASQSENIERARAILGQRSLGADAPLRGRVGFRCVAPDRLPLVGALPDTDLNAGKRIERLRDVPRRAGLHGLLGYASRGLTWAPLAAELLAATLEGEPLPLEARLAAALDPARFLLAARRRNNS